MIKVLTAFIAGIFLTLLLQFGYQQFSQSNSFISPLGKPEPTPTPNPFLPYTFQNLSQTQTSASPILILNSDTSDPDLTTSVFSYQSQGSTISGQLNQPSNLDPQSKYPAIIMLRGFVDPSIYQTGIGTRNAAKVFAANGFVTFAPDFLGFGQSDPEPSDQFIARFRKPLDVINLIASIQQLTYINSDQIFIWGHSNGGQIALSVLAITQKNYPTTLWAPVTKPFPYSILYYTDEYDDYGKALRHELARLEQSIDANQYSITSYLDHIVAPIQLHQGAQDSAIPLAWTTQFTSQLQESYTSRDLPQDLITLFTYPNADHNLQPNWQTVVARDLDFFNQYLNPSIKLDETTPLQ